jgi:hypothetical protein
MSILRPGPPVIAGVLGFLAIERALETGACPGVRANEDPPWGSGFTIQIFGGRATRHLQRVKPAALPTGV